MSSRRKQYKPSRVQSEGPSLPMAPGAHALAPPVLPFPLGLPTLKMGEDLNANSVNFSLTQCLPSMVTQKPNVIRNLPATSSQMVVDTSLDHHSYSDDPARRNKRGNRGTGKVQPRHLDNGEEVFLCPACDKEGKELFLKSREELTSHLRTHNKPIETGGGHICAICARELSSQSSLDRHMLTHSDERPYSCPLCPTSFTTNGNMRRHLSTHKSDPSLMEEVNRHLNSDKRRKRSRNTLEVLKTVAKATAAQTSFKAPTMAPMVPHIQENTTFNQAVPNFYQWLNNSFPLFNGIGGAAANSANKHLNQPTITPANKTGEVQKAAVAADNSTTGKPSSPRANQKRGWFFPRLERNARAYYLRSRKITAAHRLSKLSVRTLQHKPSSTRVDKRKLRMMRRRERYSGRRESSNVISCDICQRNCVGKKNLIVHKVSVHEMPVNKTIYCCLGRFDDGTPCMEKDEDLSSMKRHVMINHVKIDPFICKLCNPGAVLNVGLEDKHLHKQPGSFCTKENVHRHLLQKKNHEMIAEMKTKLDPGKFKLFTEKANAEFTGVVQIREDIREKYIGDDGSTCNSCQVDFKSVDILRNHFQASPNCQLVFSCPVCSLDLPQKEMLLLHIKIKHGDQENLVHSVLTSQKRLRSLKNTPGTKSPPQKMLETTVDQPLDLSVSTKKLPAKNIDLGNDSGFQQTMSSPGSASTPDKEAHVMRTPTRPQMPFFSGTPFMNPWSSPIWPGLGYPGMWAATTQQQALYMQHLSQLNSGAGLDFLKMRALSTADQLKMLKTSTPVAPVKPDVDSDDRCLNKKILFNKNAFPSMVVPKDKLDMSLSMSAPSSVRDETDGHYMYNSSSCDSGDESPSKKRIKKKNSYKDAPNLIYCPFQTCKQSFPWMSSLKRHIITHTNHKPYCCTRCNQSFSTKSNRERHMERIHHIKVKGNQSSTFLSADELNVFAEHDKVAEKIGEDLLNQLGHSVVTSVNPQRLNRSDSPDQEDSALSLSLNLSSTNNSSSSFLGPQYKCPECNLFSVDRAEVLEHLKTAHRDTWNLMTSRCQLTTVDDIIVHMHKDSSFSNGDEEEFLSDNDSSGVNGSSSRRLMCAVCTRKFWSSQDLQRHMRSHTGIKPFSCESCGRHFSLKHSLQRHFRTHHAEQTEGESEVFQPWVSASNSPADLRIATDS